jgi:RHS repeat-associated protein
VGNRTTAVLADFSRPEFDPTYSYDYENRLIRVQYSGMDAQYKYDPLGRRIEKNVNGEITKYVYDGDNLIAEYDGTDAVKSKYLFSLDIDDPLSVEQSGTVYYYHKDGLGSVTGLTNASGNIVKTYRYNSFGEIYTQTGSLVQPFTFTGREYDPESGLYYYRARYYDPMAGRFISKDPIGFEGGDVNLFRYVGNNPGNLTDPEGLAAWLLPPLIVYGPPAIAVGWSLITELARHLSITPSKCYDSDNDNKCGKMNEIDTATCNGITKVRGRQAGARCHASASQRYSECLKYGPSGVRTPLDTWNN